MEQLFFFGGIAGGVLRRTSGSSACLKKGLFESVAACLRCVFGFGIGTGCPKQAYWCLPCRRSAFAALTRWGGKRRGLWWLGGSRQRFIGFTAHCFLERGLFFRCGTRSSAQRHRWTSSTACVGLYKRRQTEVHEGRSNKAACGFPSAKEGICSQKP